MNIDKLEKLQEVAMALADCRKTAPPVAQEAITDVICYVLDLMYEEICYD